MNALIVWGNQLEVGYPAIDRQHQELIRIANHLYLAMKAARGREVIREIFVDLANYTLWHFDAEERLMRESNYPDADKHQKQHQALRNQVLSMLQEARSGRLEITLKTMNFLRRWLGHHIRVTDRALGKYLADR